MTPIPDSLDLVLFYLAGLAGVVEHWRHRRARGEMACSLVEYLFVVEKGASACMAVSLCGALALLQPTVEFASPGAALAAWLTAFAVGYAADSRINRGG